LIKDRLYRWYQVVLNFKIITRDYDPKPGVSHIDIFYTEPLAGIVEANNTQDWFDEFISRWDKLIDKPTYYLVYGGHRVMISPPHRVEFYKVFKKVLEDRGL
jgi:thioesterase domain-containing protein